MRPGDRAILLGPAGTEERKQLLLDSHLSTLGWRKLGRDVDSPYWSGSAREFSGRRSRPARHYRACVQREPDAPLHFARLSDEKHFYVAQFQRRRRFEL